MQNAKEIQTASRFLRRALLPCFVAALLLFNAANARPRPPKGRKPPPGNSTNTSQHSSRSSRNNNPFLLSEDGHIADVIGFQNIGRSDTTFDAVFYLPTSYADLQTVTDQQVYFYPANADTAEILTDTLGAYMLHLKYTGLQPRSRIVVYYTANIPEEQPRRPVTGWKNIPVPESAAAYPVSAAMFLKSGRDLETHTPRVRKYTKKIIPAKDGLTYGEAACAAVKDIDSFPFGNDNNSSRNTRFPPDYMRNPAEVLASHKCVCVECARLACAVLRNTNIPCRTATGFFGGKPWDHTWIQIFVRDIGWVDVDPQQGYCPDGLLSEEYKGKYDLYELLDPDQNETYEIQYTTDPPVPMRIMSQNINDFGDFIEQGTTRKKESVTWGEITVE